MTIPFIERPRHYFECTVPPYLPEDQIIWREHPTLPVRCNSMGVIEPLNPDHVFCPLLGSSAYGTASKSAIYRDDETTWNNKIMELGPVQKIIHECWRGQLLSPGNSVKLRYFNPWDTRPESIIVLGELTQKERASRSLDLQVFVDNTVKYMEKLQNRLGPYQDPMDLFRLLKVPKAYLKAWKEKHSNVEISKVVDDI